MLNTERIKTVARVLIGGGGVYIHAFVLCPTKKMDWTQALALIVHYQKSATKWNTQSIHNDLLFLLVNRQGANIFLKITASM